MPGPAIVKILEDNRPIYSIVPIGHGRPVEAFAGVLQVGDLRFRVGVSRDIFRQRFPTVAVISGDAIAVSSWRQARATSNPRS
jgi:hypothetical protein